MQDTEQASFKHAIVGMAAILLFMFFSCSACMHICGGPKKQMTSTEALQKLMDYEKRGGDLRDLK